MGTKKKKLTPLQLVHEDIVAQIEANRKHLNRIENDVREGDVRAKVHVLNDSVMNLRNQTIEGHRAVRERLSAIEKKLNLLIAFDQLKEGRPSPSPDPDALKPEPKEGDYVVVTGTQAQSEGRTLRVKEVRANYLGWLLSDDCYYAKKYLRFASVAEVSAYQEAEAPKKGDWVVATAENERYPEGTMFQVLGPANRSSVNVNEGAAFTWTGKHTGSKPWVRKATPEEAEEAERLKEWEGITELQVGDYAENTEAIGALIRSGNIPIAGHSVIHGTEVGWDKYHGRNKCELWTGLTNKKNKLPEAEFLRRAQGTALRLKAEREEEERKRPLEFGQEVSVMMNYVPTTYRVACDVPGKTGLYRLVPPGPPDENGNIYLKRSEFTVLPK